MPHYDFQCDICETFFHDVFFHMTGDKVIMCCGQPARRVFSVPEVNPDFYTDTIDPNLGHEPIRLDGREHRREEMKKRGLYEAG